MPSAARKKKLQRMSMVEDGGKGLHSLCLSNSTFYSWIFPDFSFRSSAAHRYLYSFPTRRSSDLAALSDDPGEHARQATQGSCTYASSSTSSPTDSTRRHFNCTGAEIGRAHV